MPRTPKGVRLGGRGVGTPNKATVQAREAIALFVDNNAHKLQEWLNEVADGKLDSESGKWLVVPNPEKAFNLFQSVVEYHVPKLARTEVTGKDGGPVSTVVNHIYQDSDTGDTSR